MTSDEPIAAVLLVGFATLLVFLDGVALLFAGNVLNSVGAGELGFEVGTLGAFALLWSLVLVTVTVQLYRSPDHHVGLGIAAIAVSVVALTSGGGFFLGTILGVIGGILAILWQDPADDEPIPEWGSAYGSPGPDPRQDRAWAADEPSPRCTNCGAALSPGAIACATCETPSRATYRALGVVAPRTPPPR